MGGARARADEEVRRLTAALGVAALAAGGLGSACGAAPVGGPIARPGLLTVASNVTRADYVGTQACARCHQQIVDAFVRSPMHRMTRRVDTTDVMAPFSGAKIDLAGGSVTAFSEQGRKYMRIASEDTGDSLWRITKVIGGRTREDFVGAKVESTDEGASTSGDERVMPASFLSFDRSWRYKGYSVMVKERNELHVGTTWKQTCIFCHNTVPLLDGLYADLAPTKQTYQGSVSDNLLPSARAWTAKVSDERALLSAVGDEVTAIGGHEVEGSIGEVLDRAIAETRTRFDEENVVELGVGCESCHLGSRAHAEDPRFVPSFTPRGSGFTLGPADGKLVTHASEVNRACARCHTVLFSGYPYTWEGGTRKAASGAHGAGGSHINSGEARDFLLGGCANDLACTACHDPHRGSSRDALDAMGTVAKNGVCTGCHEKMSGDTGLREHTHHDATGEGSACLSCHMPKKNVGLRYELTRYHRIASPTEEAKVYGDRPLECALCHADWSVEKTVSEMEKGWGKKYDRERLKKLYPDLEGNVLAQSIDQGKAHEAVTAGAALVGRGDASRIDLALPLLANDYPLVRLFIAHAIEKRTGKPAAGRPGANRPGL